jgi:hypothetical protein
MPGGKTEVNTGFLWECDVLCIKGLNHKREIDSMVIQGEILLR